MIARRIFPSLLAAFALAASIPAGAQMTTKPLTPSQMVSPDLLVKRIDVNCAVVSAAVKSQPPTTVAQVGSSVWKVASNPSDTTFTHVATTKTVANVWKQAGNYVWVHWVTHGSHGIVRADQLCFRNDGTLARARQATTVKAFDAAGGQEAYFNTDGSVIKHDVAFSLNDPAVYKRVNKLPFFKVLP
jgi:hypothetical protein